jgi:hypothetical protein
MRSNQLFQQIKSKIDLDIRSKKSKNEIEEEFYMGLSNCLISKQFESFKDLFHNSVNFDIFIDVEKIPRRFEIISNLLMNCIQEVSVGYQTSSLGEIIDILWFCNKYHLLERDITPTELIEIEEIKKDKLLIANLKDLFGEVNNSLIFYISKIMPRNLYDYFIGNPSVNSFYNDMEQLVYYIKNNFFNNYSIYGLSVKCLGSVKDFIRELKMKNIIPAHQTQEFNRRNRTFEKDIVEFSIVYKYRTNYFGAQEQQWEENEIKKHLISPPNISKNLPKILSNDYNFFSLSMILLGGIGPQGHGFSYSTPRGEIIEICTDSQQNKAIIIKFKEFLKRQFIKKLNKELTKRSLNPRIISKITNHFEDVLRKDELVNYYKKDQIIELTKDFLMKYDESISRDKRDFQNLLDVISSSIIGILRPIKIVDQFKARMNLVEENKLKSEDIAKFTSLKDKSHYDILRERLFYQYIVEWFHEIFMKNRLS